MKTKCFDKLTSAVTNASLLLAILSFTFSILDNQSFELVQHFVKV